jgi:hypothetical protein
MRNALLTFVVGLVSLAAARADTFVINPLQSILTLTATVAGAVASQQPPSGFTTSYAGTINATIGGGTIQFNSANADANVSGVYSPLPGGLAGTAPGDYRIATAGAGNAYALHGTGVRGVEPISILCGSSGRSCRSSPQRAG